MAKRAGKDKPSNATAQEMRSYVERVARLEEEKAGISSDIKDVKNEAASRGFDKKVLAQMVREYMASAEERAAQREHETLCEVYRAALGMLDGTPLGEAARKRFDDPPPPTDDDTDGEEREHEQAAPEPELPPVDTEAARERGLSDARAGKKVTDNPFTSGDPRRAAWDEGWCAATGSDGMDIPHAFRRTRRPKKPGDDPAQKEAA